VPQYLNISSILSGYCFVTCARAVRERRANRILHGHQRFCPHDIAAPNAVPEALLKVTFALFVINLTFFPAAYFTHAWIYDADGLGIPTDFVNVWAAGKLVLEGHPALAYDWDIQKQVELALLKQDFPAYFRLALSAAVSVRGLPSSRSSLRRGLRRLGVGQQSCLSRGDARDRRRPFASCWRSGFR